MLDLGVEIEPRHVRQENAARVQSEIAVTDGAAAHQVADAPILELPSAGPGEQLLAVDQRHFQPDCVEQLEAAFRSDAAGPLDGLHARVIGHALEVLRGRHAYARQPDHFPVERGGRIVLSGSGGRNKH